MSHANGAIKFSNGVIRYYEYDGTSDYVISHHYETATEVHANWRMWNEVKCVCGKEEAVSIYSDYAYGFYLEGLACRHCNSVRSKDPDFETYERNEVEDWEKDLNWKWE